MELTFLKFEVLTHINRKKNVKVTQRSLANELNISVGTVNKTLNDLIECALIVLEKNGKYKLTEKALSTLEPYRVKKAIFIAAGFGSRMVPITLNTPKPLILVHGKKIIETLLDAVIEAEIEEIIIVRGYLKDQFDSLLHKYPNIKFIENPIYNETNNISSTVYVKDLLENAYVLESDLLLSNKEIIRKYEYQTNYMACPVDKTDDWCFKTKKGIITELCVGGENVHHMFGISYWSKEDGKKLSKDIMTVFNSPGGKERYWDEVALRACKDSYKVAVRHVSFDDIVEIDTFKELKAIDKIYEC